MAPARAFERGIGGPRDYQRAAEIYASACNDGNGLVEACNALLDAIVDGRGVALDQLRALRLNAQMCKHGDPSACFITAFAEAASQSAQRRFQGDAPEHDPAEEQKFERLDQRLEQACERGDGRACLTAVSLHGGQGGASESARQERYNTACRAGLVEGCKHVVYKIWLCDGSDDCEARITAEWRRNDYNRDELAAWTRLQNMCTAGDATACREIPSRQLPATELCAAHDYGACGELGCLGDDAAAALARDHGVTDPNCQVAHNHAVAVWNRRKVGLPPMPRDRREPMDSGPAKPFEAIRFTHHGGRDPAGWPRYDVYNRNDQSAVELVVCAYAYDERYHQVARIESAVTPLPLGPGAIQLLNLATANATPVPPAAVLYAIDYARVKFGSSPVAVDATRCPAQRPFEQQQAYGW